jgi:hypothetical protein
MTVSFSGLYVKTFQTALNNTIALDVELETHKGALFTDTITPNFATDTAYAVAPYNANEVISAGPWPTGGVVLTGTTFDIATTAGTLIYDATDVSVASTTLTNAKCYLLYADALTDQCIVLVNFGANFSTVNGTFGIQWAAPASGGVFNIDLTP